MDKEDSPEESNDSDSEDGVKVDQETALAEKEKVCHHETFFIC